MSISDIISVVDKYDSEEVALMLLSSIAHEEIALAHLINVEAEKLQSALGTLNPHSCPSPNSAIMAEDHDDLFAINKSVKSMLQTIIKKEMLLHFKFNNVIEYLEKSTK